MLRSAARPRSTVAAARAARLRSCFPSSRSRQLTRRSPEPRRPPSSPGRAAPPGRARAPAGSYDREPEGRRRQDHHGGEPGRRAGPARLQCWSIDLDPQGNASTALGVDHHVGHPVGLQRAASTTSRCRESSAGPEVDSALYLRARRPSTWPARRSNWSRWWPANSGCSRALAELDGADSITCSSTARPRSAC